MIHDAVLEAATQSPTAVKSLVWKVPTILHVSRPSFDASALCGSIEAKKVAVHVIKTMAGLVVPTHSCPRDLSTMGPAILAIQKACQNFVQSGGRDVKELAWANYVAGYLSMRLVEACCKPPATVAGTLMSIGDTLFNLYRPLPEHLTKKDFEAYLHHTLRVMQRNIGPQDSRGGELLPEAWRRTCSSMTRYSRYGYNLFRHAASTAKLQMLYFRDARGHHEDEQWPAANCLSRALLGILYSREHGLKTRVVRYATKELVEFMRRSNERLPESGRRRFNHLSVDPGEEATASEEYDPCDGSPASMAMAVEDFVLMPLWAELTDLLSFWVTCSEYHQYLKTFRNVLAHLQESLGMLFPDRYRTGLLSPARKFQ
jgi:hypothetical protein